MHDFVLARGLGGTVLLALISGACDRPTPKMHTSASTAPSALASASASASASAAARTAAPPFEAARRIRPRSPHSGVITSRAVTFRWLPENEPAILEVARDASFTRGKQTVKGRGTATISSLGEGRWFWRARVEGSHDPAAVSHSRWLRVAPRGTRPVRQAQVLGYDFDGDGFEDLAFKQAVVRGAADLKQAHVQRLTAAPLGTCVLPVQAESNDGICTNLHAPHPLGDVDGDGADDLVVRLEGKGPVLFRGGARGSDPWQPARQLCLAESPCWTATDWRAIGDVDADGFADAASADGLVAHGGPAGWRRPPRPAIAARSYVGFAGGGDLDGDGFSDVVGLSRDGKLHVYRGSATGLEAARLVDVGLDAMQRDSVVARRIQLGDLDGDGFVDIIGAMDAPNESVTLWMVSGHSLADASPRVTKRVWPHKREHSWEMPWFAWTYDAHVGGASARLLVADRGEEHQELVEVTFAGGELLIGSSPRRYGWLQERKPFPCGDLDGDAQDEVCVEGAPAIDGQRTVEVVLGTPSERPPFRGLLYGFAERGEHAVFVERTTTTEAERKQLHASGIETYESGSP